MTMTILIIHKNNHEDQDDDDDDDDDDEKEPQGEYGQLDHSKVDPVEEESQSGAVSAKNDDQMILNIVHRYCAPILTIR